MKIPIKYLGVGTRFIYNVERWEVCNRTFLHDRNEVSGRNFRNNVIEKFTGDTLVGVDEWDLPTQPLNQLSCGTNFIYYCEYWTLSSISLGRYEVMNLQTGEIRTLNPNTTVYALNY